MNFKSRYLLMIFSVGILFVGFSANANAYLDPATGSIVLQGLIAGVCGALVVVKVFWHKITGFFRRSDPSSEEADRDERE